MPNPATGTAPPIIIDGLTPGEAYYVQYQQRNEYGWSPWSDPSVSVTPTDAGFVEEVLEDAPLGYWRLGEASGTIARNFATGAIA